MPFASLAMILLSVPSASAPLPYDASCPAIYDNDGAIESGFTDVYVMALASAGVIKLRGIITTCSYGEYERKPPYSARPPAEVIRERQELVEKARRSGLRHLPDVTAGSSLSLERPASGRIDDTVPENTAGARLILREAKRATPAKPLVLLMGGQATTVVSAYLLDPAIADRMVLAWTVGDMLADGGLDSREYNAMVDPWATYIAFERLRVVAFPCQREGRWADGRFAETPKSRLGELPDTELRETMKEAAWPRGHGTFSEPSSDADAMGAIAMTRPDYVLETHHVTFSHWAHASWPPPRPGHAPRQSPCFKQSPDGRVIVAWKVDGAAATDEWWRRIKDPAAWGKSEGEMPFGGKPWAIPGRIEAVRFDHGGEGRAYHDTTNNFKREGWFNPFRCLEQVDIVAAPGTSSSYAVTRTAPREWMAYTVDVSRAGTYEAEVRMSSAGKGGVFHLELGGSDKTGPIHVPDTGGEGKWRTVTATGLKLSAGRQVLRIVMDAAGRGGSVGDFDWLRFTRTGD